MEYIAEDSEDGFWEVSAEVETGTEEHGMWHSWVIADGLDEETAKTIAQRLNG